MAEEGEERRKEEETLAASLASETQTDEQPELEEEEVQEEEQSDEERQKSDEEMQEEHQVEEEVQEQPVEEEEEVEQKEDEEEVEQEESVQQEEESDEEVGQPEEVAQLEEVPSQETQKEVSAEMEEERPLEKDTCDVTAEEVPTPEKQLKKGKTVPTTPSRTNPSRKAKELSTPVTPMSMASEKISPRAKIRVEFSPTVEESVSQEVGQPEELPSPTSHTDRESSVNESLKDEEELQEEGSEWESQKSEQPDEEFLLGKPSMETPEVVDAGLGGEQPRDDNIQQEVPEEMEKVPETSVDKKRQRWTRRGKKNPRRNHQ